MLTLLTQSLLLLLILCFPICRFFLIIETFFYYASSSPSPQVLCTRTLGCGHIWRRYLCRCNCPISRDLFRKGPKLLLGMSRGHRSTLGRDVTTEKEMNPQHKIPKSCWGPGMHQPQATVRANCAAAPPLFQTSQFQDSKLVKSRPHT